MRSPGCSCLTAVFFAVTGVVCLLASALVVLAALLPREVLIDTVVWAGALWASLYYVGLVRPLRSLLLAAAQRGCMDRVVELEAGLCLVPCLDIVGRLRWLSPQHRRQLFRFALLSG